MSMNAKEFYDKLVALREFLTCIEANLKVLQHHLEFMHEQRHDNEIKLAPLTPEEILALENILSILEEPEAS